MSEEAGTNLRYDGTNSQGRPSAASSLNSSRPLTSRELEVLQLAAHGSTGPQIAEALFVSPSTVKTHFENIYEKLGVRGRTAAVATAMRLGLVD